MMLRAAVWVTALLAGSGSLAAHAQTHRVVLLSVDGLDYRYLRDCDRLGLKVPNLRRLMREGVSAQGVTGEVPTITWPAHTTILTGVPPSVHGIQQNQRWDYSLIQVKTLWDALAAVIAPRLRSPGR